jgi:hypothetical protein
MTINSSSLIPDRSCQSGLWGMQVPEVREYQYGECSYYDVHQAPIQSVLPLMNRVNEDSRNDAIGKRCAAMAKLRYGLVHSLFKPNTNFDRMSVSQIMSDANVNRATVYSQKTLARLLALQLIGAGYDVNRECDFRHSDPRAKPLIGTSDGFQGFDTKRMLLSGPATRCSQVQKMTGFMGSVRNLAGQYLAAHEARAGDVRSLVNSDQLAHRGRLVMLAADPHRLQDQPEFVYNFLNQLDMFERTGIAGRSGPQGGDQLAASVIQAKRVLLT